MLQRGYVASERVGADAFISFLNGGVRTFVKRSLALDVATDEHVYKHKIDYFIGADALANKGVLHTSFNKDGKRFHYLNTHLQAYYPGREHYTEVTLAQCVEIKRFIDAQKAKGIIKPGDTIVLGGDFNIPRPGRDEESTQLYKKMLRLLGPQFTTLTYDTELSVPNHTVSRENSYNSHIAPSSDCDVNLDVMMLYDPNFKDTQLVDVELSTIYCDIQLSISKFVMDNATLFSLWKLSDEAKVKLEEFNLEIEKLYDRAEELKLQKTNPLDDPEWFEHAIKLLSGPEKSSILMDGNENEEEPGVEASAIIDDDSTPENIQECKEKFDRLMAGLRQVHELVHKNYMDSPQEYKVMYAASLKMNHVLFNAGDQFFKNPTVAAYRRFERTCNEQLNTAVKIFENNASIWERLDPIIKQFLGLVSLLTVVPGLLVAAGSTHGFAGTFFGSHAPQAITDVKKDYEEDSTHEP